MEEWADLLIRNLDFLLKSVDFIMKTQLRRAAQANVTTSCQPHAGNAINWLLADDLQAPATDGTVAAAAGLDRYSGDRLYESR